ncbi:hypothetical protein DdX_16753 [Ditylenchus destructor]|uniref:F-box domain-containing protein n=1 Tax=Ditylenchus destructor TaxID=166010 RepID=A0AAD4MSN0_9BILA|nr:hypothetical protein DdX_16753 [Ditylenchus destructor]
MSQKIPDELLISSFQFLDRMQLLALLGISRGIYSKIEREFDDEPYLMISDLNCDYLSGVSPIRYFLKSISHLWTGHNLILNSSSLQPSPELFRLISASSGFLELKFKGSLTVFSQGFLEQDRYYHISISDSSYGPNSDFPYSEIIADILCASGSVEPEKNVRISSRCQPSYDHRIRIFNAIKKKFMSATKSLNFRFEWCFSDGNNYEGPYEEFIIKKTNRLLKQKMYKNIFTVWIF